MKKLIIVINLILLIVFLGCTIKTGRLFYYENRKNIEIGQSKKEIIDMFGEPFMKINKKGHECWIYNYSENIYNGFSVSDPRQINLGIMFDDNSKVWSYEYNRNYTPVENVKIGPFYENKK